MELLEIWSPANTVQQVSQYFIDLGETGQWRYYSTLAVLFYFLLFLAVYANSPSVLNLNSGGKSFIKKIILSDITLVVFMLVVILMARIPLAVTGIQNPDELWWTAEAKTLLNDPRFFVSAETGIGGAFCPACPKCIENFWIKN